MYDAMAHQLAVKLGFMLIEQGIGADRFVIVDRGDPRNFKWFGPRSEREYELACAWLARQLQAQERNA